MPLVPPLNKYPYVFQSIEEGAWQSALEYEKKSDCEIDINVFQYATYLQHFEKRLRNLLHVSLLVYGRKKAL